ncbi:ATP-binding cassette domain-containing protein [Mycetocola sp. 2940]|uniref:sulfate/molybdate ABC transporter ATP-binding protein n=1 Tax=Mycetocola sp. 2940 TaxID=3156452 RepID=UPI00339624E8
MSVEVDVVDTARGLDARFRLESGRLLALVGPNGAGKSSLLAAISGIFRPGAGHIRLDGRSLFSGGSTPTSLPPQHRGVALLGQDPLLFPHLTVRDNVAFAPRSSGLSRSASRVAADAWLDITEAAHLRDLRPHELSGGQAQRVSIARALAAEPRLLLLDEPFSATDVAAVPALRVTLARVLHARTAILVSHALGDIVALADDVVSLESGRVVDEGTLAEVLTAPRSPFLRTLASSALLLGTRTGNGIRLDDGSELAGIAPQEIPPGDRAFARFGPGGLTVYPDHAAIRTEDVCAP